ncbi:MAG: xanthine dehydrogenase family protein molybdopterin-binding subunit [Actinomycetota bacterium]
MSILGTRVLRTEDPDLLTIGGKYVDDLIPEGALQATFVRSVMAHAEVTGIDTSDAEGMPGVVAVYTAESLALEAKPPAFPMLNGEMKRTWLAGDRVRYVGEPVAIVLSETAEQGVDAAEMVIVDYEPLDAVVDMRDSLTGDTLLFPEAGTNVTFAIPGAVNDEFWAGCEVRTSLSFRNQRLSGAPIEPRSCSSVWSTDDDGREFLTQWATTQNAHGTKGALAGAMGLDEDQVRVICPPDVGGGFGAKNGGYVEDLTVTAAARTIGRPVHWIETRSESMLGLAHGRASIFDCEIGGTADGKILAFACDQIKDSGAYPAIGAVLPFITRTVSSTVYDIPKISWGHNSVMTNTVPTGAYRGAGRPEAAHALDRMIDVFADEIGMDPAEVRRINFIAPEQFPHTTAAGADMDSGRYADAMDKVMEHADYPALLAEQAARREDPSQPLMGLGWCAYVEIANPMQNGEFGQITVHNDGSATVLTGSSAHGQGHHTAFAQVASDITGITFDKIEVRHGDTAEVPRGGGTGGSKSLQVGGSAVMRASEGAVEMAKATAAGMLEASVDDIVLDTDNGTFAVAGTPAISRSWAEIATEVESTGVLLSAEHDFTPGGATFPFGVHLAVVDVDRETGQVTPQRHICCDDAGTLVNPMIVDGQVHGGIASGIAQATMEEFAYDEWGNPTTGNFMDYAIVSAAELPSFERIEQETATDRNPIGAKGVGESGTIGATPAVQNAVVDALSHLGVRHVEIPCTPQRVWHAIHNAM